jgi:hypothetical protein
MICIGLNLVTWANTAEVTAQRDRPSGFASEIEPGVNDGEVDFTTDISAVDWGDAVVQGDNAGTLGILEWWNSVDGWQTLVDPADSEFYTTEVYVSLWGTTATIKVRTKNAQGVTGNEISEDVVIPGTIQELQNLVIDTDLNDIPDGNVLNVALEPMTIYVEA